MRLVNGSQIWWVVASYTIALIAVGFHLRHGFWSAFTTLGRTPAPGGVAGYLAPTWWQC